MDLMRSIRGGGGVVCVLLLAWSESVVGPAVGRSFADFVLCTGRKPRGVAGGELGIVSAMNSRVSIYDART